MKNQNQPRQSSLAAVALEAFLKGAHRPGLQAAPSAPKPWSDSNWPPTDRPPEQHACGYIRPKAVSQMLSISMATLYRKVRAGTFIPPIKLGPRLTVFSRADIYRWLSEQGGQK